MKCLKQLSYFLYYINCHHKPGSYKRITLHVCRVDDANTISIATGDLIFPNDKTHYNVLNIIK
jgi:hypothetical protein